MKSLGIDIYIGKTILKGAADIVQNSLLVEIWILRAK